LEEVYVPSNFNNNAAASNLLQWHLVSLLMSGTEIQQYHRRISATGAADCKGANLFIQSAVALSIRWLCAYEEVRN